MKLRWIETLFAAGLIIALLGGALLWADLRGVADDTANTAEETAAVAEKNAELICALGSAVTGTKIEQRGEENLNEFQRRVRTIRRFVMKLNELDDCDAKRPNAIRLKKKDREKLRQERRRRQGGGRQQGNPPSQQPGGQQPASPQRTQPAGPQNFDTPGKGHGPPPHAGPPGGPPGLKKK